MRNQMKLADADAHQMEPDDLWEKYIDPRFKAAAPRIGKSPGGKNSWMVEGETFTLESGHYLMSSPALQDKERESMQRNFKRLIESAYSAQVRLLDMDDHGVDVQILYPTRGGQMIGRDFHDSGPAGCLLSRLQ